MRHRPGRSSGVDNTTPFKFCTLCYSIVSCIHVNIKKLRNITCTLVATCVILWSLECTMKMDKFKQYKSPIFVIVLMDNFA